MSLREFASFHSIDIQAYARLVKKLSYNPSHAKKIVAFWVCLEQQGNTDFIRKILSWSIISFRQAAIEADECLEFFRREVYHECDTYYNFLQRARLLSSLIRPAFIFSRETRRYGMERMERFENIVLDCLIQYIVPRDVADDMMSHINRAMARGEELIRDSWMRGGQEDNLTIQDLASLLIRSKGLLITSPECHHFTKEELEDFFKRQFEFRGVEAVYVDLYTMPSFALVVCVFPSRPKAIVRGTSPVLFSINGKSACARRYNPCQM